MKQREPERLERIRNPVREARKWQIAVFVSLGFLLSGELLSDEAIVATPVEVEARPAKLLKRPGFFRRAKKQPARQVYEPRKLVATPVPVLPKLHRTAVSRDDSLPALIEEALANNPDLKSARQNEIIQLAKSDFTRKDAFPLLAVYGTRDSQPPSTFGIRNQQYDRSERNALGLTAEQPLLDWGENRGKIEMEKHQAKSHYWSARVKELETIYHVTESYWRLVFFKEVVDLRKRALDAKRREKISIEDRVDAKEARTVDLLFVEAGVAGAEQELFKAQNGYELATAQLLFYIGRKSCDKVCVNDRLTVSPTSLPDVVNLDCHPEMQRVKSAEMAALTAEQAAKAGRLPKVVLRGHIEDSNSRESAGTTNLVPDGTNYELGAYVSVPVGRQWVAATARLNEAYAKQVQLAADASTLSTSLRLRIQDAQNRVEEALKSVTVAGKNETAAIENLKLRKKLALIKNATRADVAKAENEYNEARVGVLKAKYDVKEARAHLERELGMVNP